MSGVSFTKVNFCGAIRTNGCFDIKSEIVAPLLLIVDKQGNIVFQHSGWTESAADSASLIRSLPLNKP
jgi:hypothetical protein